MNNIPPGAANSRHLLVQTGQWSASLILNFAPNETYETCPSIIYVLVNHSNVQFHTPTISTNVQTRMLLNCRIEHPCFGRRWLSKMSFSNVQTRNAPHPEL
jgi:hypothetical protein